VRAHSRMWGQVDGRVFKIVNLSLRPSTTAKRVCWEHILDIRSLEVTGQHRSLDRNLLCYWNNTNVLHIDR